MERSLAIEELAAYYRGIFSRPPEELRTLAHIKRYLERFVGDVVFREAVLSGSYDLQQSAEEAGCDLDVHSLLPIFHPEYAKHRTEEGLKDWPLASMWENHYRAMLAFRTTVRQCADSRGFNPSYDAWRQRQITRVELDVGITSIGIVHAPVAFELSGGCTVGCWFCGVSAERFKGHFRLADGGADEWRRLLVSIQSVIGQALGNGFLYWATDPLDNPDYLEFLEIFHEVTGNYPQTTTAIPLRDVALTRRVLELWRRDPCFPNRFSVLNNKLLLQIHKEFTPEELLGTELVLQNDGNANATKVSAGRALGSGKTDAVVSANRAKFTMNPGTIACVSGFLINIFDRTVKLISPCSATPAYPKGYVVFAEEKYDDPDSLRMIMEGMVANRMKERLTGNMSIRLSANFLHEDDAEQICVRTPSMTIDSAAANLVSRYVGSRDVGVLELIQDAVRNGNDPLFVIDAIDRCRNSGLVDYVE
jgi:radical SAM family RiPP maturation amino acid epimerase